MKPETKIAVGAPPALPKTAVRSLLDWFEQARRPLPWRKDYAPYDVWISEIMLQQTQMERGVRYFNAWKLRFPDIQSVAGASEEDILAAWEGLGYYSRARNLRRAAETILREHDGRFPDNLDAIRRLPGIGDYTAGAIASIAFNIPAPAVDANVLRIFSRLLDIDNPVTEKTVVERVRNCVAAVMPAGHAREFNQALMELGALVCGKAPDCPACPVPEHCRARKNGTARLRPIKPPKAGYASHETVAAIVMANGKALVRRRPNGGLWAGLWEFPGKTLASGDSPADAAIELARKAVDKRVEMREDMGSVKHGYTTNRVTLHGFTLDALADAAGRAPADGEYAWKTPEELSGIAFAAGHRKLLEKLGWKNRPKK